MKISPPITIKPVPNIPASPITPIPSGNNLAFGGLAGLFGMLGLTALYIGLARGRMGIVAPVSAVVGAVLPIIIGMFMEGTPSGGQILGLVLGLCAIWYLAALVLIAW